jgi:hypothetical protein
MRARRDTGGELPGHAFALRRRLTALVSYVRKA